MKNIHDLRVAFIGVSHWHVPLYLRAVKKYNLNVISVSDANIDPARRIAFDLGCRAFREMQDLLCSEKPDFVFAFGRHCDLPQISKVLIDLNIPFAVEKPLGMRAAEVENVLVSATKKKVFCSIPFVWRYSGIVNKLREIIKPEDVVHMSFSFVAGPPDRYVKTSPWMLAKETAGGGCMTNLGVHFIDLALFLSGSRSATVESANFHYSWGCDVEDYAVSLLKLESGATLYLETGYAYPMDSVSKRDNRWTIVTKRGYYSLGDGFFDFREFGSEGIHRTEMDTDSDTYYSDFVHESLNEYVSGSSPTTGLEDMLRVRKILDHIQIKAGAAE
jgi:predicted dehydrogenase